MDQEEGLTLTTRCKLSCKLFGRCLGNQCLSRGAASWQSTRHLYYAPLYAQSVNKGQERQSSVSFHRTCLSQQDLVSTSQTPDLMINDDKRRRRNQEIERGDKV